MTSPNPQEGGKPVSAEALLSDIRITGLQDGERLIVMKQNPHDNYRWSRPVGEFTAGEIRAALLQATGGENGR